MPGNELGRPNTRTVPAPRLFPRGGGSSLTRNLENGPGRVRTERGRAREDFVYPYPLAHALGSIPSPRPPSESLAVRPECVSTPRRIRTRRAAIDQCSRTRRARCSAMRPRKAAPSMPLMPARNADATQVHGGWLGRSIIPKIESAVPLARLTRESARGHSEPTAGAGAAGLMAAAAAATAVPVVW